MAKNSKICCNLISFSIDLSEVDEKDLVQTTGGHVYLRGRMCLKSEPDTYGNDIYMTFQQTKQERLLKKGLKFIPGAAKTVNYDKPKQ